MLPQDAWEDRAGPILPFVFQAEITLRGLLEVGRGHGELSLNNARCTQIILNYTLNCFQYRQGVMRGSVQLLKAVTVLRKICNHPDLVVGPDGRTLDSVQEESSSDNDDDGCFYGEERLVEVSGKLQVLAKILPLWHKQGHRFILFCQWRKTLNIIEQFTRQQNWKFARLDGNTNVASRLVVLPCYLPVCASSFAILLTLVNSL